MESLSSGGKTSHSSPGVDAIEEAEVRECMRVNGGELSEPLLFELSDSISTCGMASAGLVDGFGWGRLESPMVATVLGDRRAGSSGALKVCVYVCVCLGSDKGTGGFKRASGEVQTCPAEQEWCAL